MEYVKNKMLIFKITNLKSLFTRHGSHLKENVDKKEETRKINFREIYCNLSFIYMRELILKCIEINFLRLFF